MCANPSAKPNFHTWTRQGHRFRGRVCDYPKCTTPWAAFLAKGLQHANGMKSPDEGGEEGITVHLSHSHGNHTHAHTHSHSGYQSKHCVRLCVCCVFLRGLVKRHMVLNSMCPDLNYCDSVHQLRMACCNANVCVACTVEFTLILPKT